MGTFKFYWKVSGPMRALCGGLTAWIIALLSGSEWVSRENIMAAIVASLVVLSSSVWHYGARHDLYERKYWDPIHIGNPKFLIKLGLFGFVVSFVLALKYLPLGCMATVLITAVAIALYAKRLDQYWPAKNLVIAGVWTTPLLIGWFSGHKAHPGLPLIIGATFFIFLAREILKDVVDQEADRGKRLTMAMSLGLPATLRISGGIILIAFLFICLASNDLPDNIGVWLVYVLGAVQMGLIAIKLIVGNDLSKKYRQIDIGVGTLLFCLLLIGFSMY